MQRARYVEINRARAPPDPTFLVAERAGFERLGTVAGPAGLIHDPRDSTMLAIYHDDPEGTPLAELRSDAGLTVSEDAALPEGLEEQRIPAGRYACVVHEGSYERLGDTWARLMGEWVPASGQRVGDGPSYEVYRNTPGAASEDELRTELYVPLA
jgi:AraC family transcriptional regulator